MLLPLLCMLSLLNVCLTTFHKALAIVHVYQQAEMNEANAEMQLFFQRQ